MSKATTSLIDVRNPTRGWYYLCLAVLHRASLDGVSTEPTGRIMSLYNDYVQLYRKTYLSSNAVVTEHHRRPVVEDGN